MRDVLLTQGTVWFLGQAGEWFGVVGALTAWCDGCSRMRAAGAITRPGIKQQEAQPHECDQCELVEKQVRHHGNAPSYRCEIGAFYLAFGQDNYPQRPGTRPNVSDLEERMLTREYGDNSTRPIPRIQGGVPR
jgi:hypothetical protein